MVLVVPAMGMTGNVVSEKEDYSYKTDFDSQGAYKVRVIVSDGEAEKLKVRSIVGLLPFCAATTFEGKLMEKYPEILRFSGFCDL